MIYAIYRLADGVVVSHFVGSPRQLEHNIPDGCAAREGEVDVRRFKVDTETQELVEHGLPQPDDLAAQVKALAQEEIDRLEKAKVRALTDHVLAPDVEIDVRGRRMLPLDRVSELEAAIVEQRKRLQASAASSEPLPLGPAPPQPE